MKVLILGYYYRNNIGDDIFAYVFQNYFNKYWPNIDLVIENTDDITEITYDTNLVICGGGDIINDYFLSNINTLINNKNIPIYGVSIGFPYPNMIDQGVLDFFDYMIYRNSFDQQKLSSKYGPNRSHHFPDLAFLLPLFSSNTITSPIFQTILQNNPNSKFKNIGIFLSRTIYNRNNPKLYNKIIENIAYFIVKLAQTKNTSSILNNNLLYQIYLIPCCTSINSNEDDRYINQDIMNQIKNTNFGIVFNNIHNINHAFDKIDEILPIFKQFYFTICTRFHAHILSILAKVPILSIFSSRKVKDLLNTCNIQNYSVEMEVDPVSLAPIKLDSWPLFDRYNLLINNYGNYRNAISILSDNYQSQMNDFTIYFNNLLFSQIRNIYNPIVIESNVTTITNKIASEIVNYFGNYLSNLDKHSFISQIASRNSNDYLSIFEFISLTHVSGDVTPPDPGTDIIITPDVTTTPTDTINLKKFVSELIIFNITGLRNTEFNYGMEQQIFTPTYQLYSSVKWILSEINKNINYQPILSNPIAINLRKFDMQHFKQHDLKGFHRSGWEFVVNHLERFQNSNGPIFDSFLDKTFCWNYDFYQKINILPFKRSWTGIFHHTHNQDFSINNLVDVFNKPLFIQSLPHCLGIYVLSQYLATWISAALINLNFPNIPINVLTHPTEFVSNTFTFTKFLNNPNKRVIQIGAWLRNTYAIFQLPTPRPQYGGLPQILIKTALKGKNMDNYYITPMNLNNITDSLYDIGCHINDNNRHHGDMCRPHHSNSNCNKYIVGLIDMIEENDNSVEILPNVNNDDYDQLLAENIVFINLVDASAVNTVIECIVRNTPILVNRLPAVVECLGPDYPLYYDSLVHAYEILNNFNLLKSGYDYLTKLNKDKFNIDYFLESLINSSIFQSI